MSRAAQTGEARARKRAAGRTAMGPRGSAVEPDERTAGSARWGLGPWPGSAADRRQAHQQIRALEHQGCRLQVAAPPGTRIGEGSGGKCPRLAGPRFALQGDDFQLSLGTWAGSFAGLKRQLGQVAHRTRARSRGLPASRQACSSARRRSAPGRKMEGHRTPSLQGWDSRGQGYRGAPSGLPARTAAGECLQLGASPCSAGSTPPAGAGVSAGGLGLPDHRLEVRRHGRSESIRSRTLIGASIHPGEHPMRPVSSAKARRATHVHRVDSSW